MQVAINQHDHASREASIKYRIRGQQTHAHEACEDALNLLRDVLSQFIN